MPKFRKKPVVIEAYEFQNKVGEDKRPQWLLDAIHNGSVWFQGGPSPYLTIRTLEGDMRADVGDWIIRGVKQELYPCKPDIFAATYEFIHEPLDENEAAMLAAAKAVLHPVPDPSAGGQYKGED